jgi:pSer/pThr/pTyr-binding forkhead associated (FHA) protein
MLDVRFTYSSDDGLNEAVLDRDRMSLGRGDVDQRIDDAGLSRLHATVYRDGDRVWVVDENSTNGTFVNGQPVHGSGTPLKNGDILRIGDHTNIQVSISEPASAPSPVANISSSAPQSAPAAASGPIHILPIVLIAGAVFIISVTTVVIGFTVFGGGSKAAIVQRTDYDPDEDKPAKKEPKDTPTSKSGSNESSTPTTNDNSSLMPSGTGPSTPQQTLPSGKKYLDMSDAERRQYLEVKAMKVAQIIGNSGSESIPSGAIDKIKGFVDAYASRVRAKTRTSGCGFGDNLQATFERASKNAPFINKAFNEKGMDPRIGLYLAMIESEHCVCLQSPTGPLGMFQFTRATAALHGLKVFAGASPSNPDERCEPEPAARAAASYMKALTGRYGTGPSSVPLAIASYNSGEGGLSSNLDKALSSGEGLPREFWTLISHSDILNKQFQTENFKYVPKFFAAAIIGENPQDFGMNLQPISTYTK